MVKENSVEFEDIKDQLHLLYRFAKRQPCRKVTAFRFFPLKGFGILPWLKIDFGFLFFQKQFIYFLYYA